MSSIIEPSETLHRERQGGGRRRLPGVGLIGVALAGVVGLWLVSDCFYEVQPTELAAVRRFGVVLTRTPVGPGLHLKAPLIDTVDRLQVSVDTLSEPDMQVYTVDNQPVRVGITLTYRIPPDAVLQLLYGVGRAGDVDIQQNIRPVIADRTLRVFARHNTLRISAEREAIAGEVRNEIQQALTPIFGLEIADLQIASIRYSDSFMESVEAAVRSKNDALAAENTVARIRYEGEQRKVQAEAQAAAAVTAAEADKRAAVLRAEGEAEAIQLKGAAEAKVLAQRAAAIGAAPGLVAYTFADRWNGAFPSTMLSGNGGGSPLTLLQLPAH